MKNLFNYENKFMELLMTVGDLVILNLLFLLCCIPVVTIGAAQAGLYTGLRVLTDKEDDSSPTVAFFRGFANGFGSITGAYCIMLVLIVVVGYSAASVMFYDMNGISAPVVISMIGLFFSTVYQSLFSIFHSRFACTMWQLFRNAWLIFLAHPLRGILVALLNWFPVALFLVDLQIFILGTPIIMTVYFSFAFLLCNTIMKKPFDDVIQMLKEKTQPEQTQEEAESVKEEITQ